ncbi:hypothetical protein FAEPRAM212_02196 [Faecalibacterium prausnitzii M21/2]|uniref:Uncharacterized protein n=1 Tax=Faecalibacterium prausnitzii M21/2 TaxID=411485 RepID=A8SDE3_9FIRM|nr:hypothetical protein FAEPRAM212_02196 [Faecalibacterium prausnitzii M21/2]
MLLACLFKADAVDFMSFSAFAKGNGCFDVIRHNFSLLLNCKGVVCVNFM